ncbi:MAG: tRNA uridine-5-carboxymethylaminomethyl(34) synthesis GTPase MnmE [bacterium]
MMDTIAAIATPVGQSAIGIIKISGPCAIEIAQKIYKGRKGQNLALVPSHTLHYGIIFDPEKQRKIDEILIAIMRSPNSYTREDVVEINCHGGTTTLYKILELVLQAGARLAEPGEFTKRAFLNGRIDLTQAEAVIDLINVQSEDGLHLLVNQLEGCSFKPLYAVEREIEEWGTLIEAELNFTEELSLRILPEELLSAVNKWDTVVEEYLEGYKTRNLLVEGVKLVIAGKTNVGKSSLMNRILQKERSIITCIPGTTTDVIEESFYLNGIRIHLSDTAGFGQSKNEIEKEGIRRSEESISKADLILFILDGSKPLDEHDYATGKLITLLQKEFLVILNKADLGLTVTEDSLTQVFKKSVPVLSISALTGKGVSEITQTISEYYLTGKTANTHMAINLRQKLILDGIKESLTGLASIIQANYSEDLLAEEFKCLSKLFKQLRGKLFTNDMLDRIFEKFCIGK